MSVIFTEYHGVMSQAIQKNCQMNGNIDIGFLGGVVVFVFSFCFEIKQSK